MIVVIQCQGKKYRNDDSFQTTTGKTIAFVAQPSLAPTDDTLIYARPDDMSDTGKSWRQLLLAYNRDERNPRGFLPAYKLYQEPVYERLAHKVTVEKLYILSAGWGLIPASFFTPYYNITFSQVKREKRYIQRKASDHYDDFAMIPPSTDERILFFGSSKYVPLFCTLTGKIQTEKIVFYNTEEPPEAPNCLLRDFVNAKRNTNWQYDCANAFLEGSITV